MKNFLLMISAVTFLTTSCKNKAETKAPEVEVKTEEVAKDTYQVSSEGSEVYWTGYKFTEKKGVKGKFKTINVTNAPVADSPMAALNGVEFSIPVSSIFSENEIRDGKLKTLFFGLMDQTEFLSGNFITKADKLFLNLKMNGTMKEIPLTHKIADRHLRVEGTLNILDFGAEAAFNSIHKACEVLHTGSDNVSKTWEEVAIEAIIFLKK